MSGKQLGGLLLFIIAVGGAAVGFGFIGRGEIGRGAFDVALACALGSVGFRRLLQL